MPGRKNPPSLLIWISAELMSTMRSPTGSYPVRRCACASLLTSDHNSIRGSSIHGCSGRCSLSGAASYRKQCRKRDIFHSCAFWIAPSSSTHSAPWFTDSAQRLIRRATSQASSRMRRRSSKRIAAATCTPGSALSSSGHGVRRKSISRVGSSGTTFSRASALSSRMRRTSELATRAASRLHRTSSISAACSNPSVHTLSAVSSSTGSSSSTTRLAMSSAKWFTARRIDVSPYGRANEMSKRLRIISSRLYSQSTTRCLTSCCSRRPNPPTVTARCLGNGTFAHVAPFPASATCSVATYLRLQLVVARAYEQS